MSKLTDRRAHALARAHTSTSTSKTLCYHKPNFFSRRKKCRIKITFKRRKLHLKKKRNEVHSLNKYINEGDNTAT